MSLTKIIRARRTICFFLQRGPYSLAHARRLAAEALEVAYNYPPAVAFLAVEKAALQ